MPNIAEVFQKEEYEPGEEDKLESIEFINVAQFIDGMRTSIPQQFTVDELGTVEQIHAALGPGSYELIGRNGRNSRIVGKCRVNVAAGPGESLRRKTQETVPQPVAIPTGVDKSDQMLMFMMQMQQSQAQQAATMMQGMMGMITAVLTTGNSNADKHTEQMAQLFTQFGQQQAQLTQTMLATAGSKDPQAVFLSALETLKELQLGANEAKAEGSGVSDLTETIGAISQGIDAYSKLQGVGKGESSG